MARLYAATGNGIARLDEVNGEWSVEPSLVGGLDLILGDVERDLKRILALADERAEEALAEYERRLETRVSDARSAERRLADLIMDTRSFRQDEVQRLLDRKSILSNDDLKAFALGALNELGVLIERHSMIDHVFELRLRGKSADEFPKIVRDGNVRVVTFDPATALEHEEVEFLAFGNELVDSLVAFIQRREYPGRVSHRRIRTNDIEPRSGWFFAYALEFEGVMRSKEILPVFIGADGTPDEELAAWLIERATKVKREEWRDPAALPARDSSFDRAVSGRCRRSSAGGGSCRRAARAGVARGGGVFEGFVEPPTGGPAAERETTSAPHHVPPGRPGLRARTQMMAISYSQNPHEPPPKGQTEREVSA